MNTHDAAQLLTAKFEAATRDPALGADPRKWMAEADHAAQRMQAQVQRSRRQAILAACGALAALAAAALATRLQSPLILCPVIVYLMIRYLDALRLRPALFAFVSLRLAAETLRLLIAVRGNAKLLDWMLASRKTAAHQVCALAAAASRAFEQFAAAGPPATGDEWTSWIEEQRTYFGDAEARERAHAATGRHVFNGAFLTVALIGIATMAITLGQPAKAPPSALLLLTVLASTIGSCGLAYVSYVRDMRAFDHSFDYLHMKQVLAAYPHDVVNLPESQLRVLREAATEHERWALRMAGHFHQHPL